MPEFLTQPWPWYVSGPLIGLMVPALLILGNRPFGISSSLKHICAACFPANIPFFHYNWKDEIWNLFFAAGILIGAWITWERLYDFNRIPFNPRLIQELNTYGISNFSEMVPAEIVNWQGLLTLKGFIMIVIGGFLIGFGTRYADGCTSGHTITGLSNLQRTSLIATICFMVGGLLVANFLLPLILKM